MSLLCGASSFSSITSRLLQHQAIAPVLSTGYYRLGENLPTYLHLGRLWADAEFQLKVTNWLRIAFLRMSAGYPGVGDKGRGLVILAILHPAIELAHELIRCPSFSEAEIVEIRRASQLRWDFEPLLKVEGQNVAILIDMVLTGKTVRRIAQAVEHIGLHPWACFSVISIEGCQLGVQERAYCQCSNDELRRLAEKAKNGGFK